MSPRPEAPLPDAPLVAICVATCRRPAGIRALIESLNRLEFTGAAPRVTLIVADNDPTAPAFATPEEAQALSRWPLVYLHEPRRGIVAARNRTLSAVPEDADLVAFVDDDETVSPGWLEALLTTFRATGAAAVQGPVEPAYDAPPPEWIEALGIFRLGPFAEGEALAFAATNNSLVDARVLRRLGRAFDDRFNDTGGEDEELYGRLRASGGTIRAAARAVVYDTVPANRMTLSWVLRRWHRMGNTLGRIALLRRRGRAMRLVKGVGALGLGLAQAALAAPFSRVRSIRGLMEAARGAGMLSAFLHLHAAEYAPARLASDRGGRS
jgi:succinoglycan biosynthesis protein ExoM